jgi:transposase
VSEPQLIDDQEHERVFERVAAVDVAKAAGMVCTRGPHPSRPGVRQAAVWEVPATMNAVSALADQLAAAGVQKVTLGSTSDYWRIWYYLLEAAGLDVQLVSATQVRQLAGRPKTDVLTELREGLWLVSGRVASWVATFPDRDHGRGSAAGSVAAGGAAAWVA